MQKLTKSQIACLLAAISLAACGGGSGTADLSGLTRRNTPLTGYVGHVNNAVVESQTGTVSIASGPIMVDGWAIDFTNHETGDKMYMNVNGKAVSCEYGIPRLDVSTALKDTRYVNSGYRCNIPEADLKHGDNSFEPVLVSRDKSYSTGATLHVHVGR
jgi:hypothetical protein